MAATRSALADQLGELPATLSHRTPHGAHRIYRTPPGWTGRAWVGKDAGNPLPAGIDLRVPGQILMAPPSQVPAPGGLIGYGPVAGSRIADLPAAYITAWTPPRAQAVGAARPLVPVPPGRANAAASYVHAKINGIVADLASREPGGRNTAIYTAALKVGSTLGAAGSTPGAEHAAGAWSAEAAEDALMAAAKRNGYIADHSAAAARSAVRSGLRNGLRSPRPLPDFSSPIGPSPELRRGRAPDEAGHDNRMRASRAAVAANAAYRAGNLDRARQLTDQAASLDPARADLWRRHRAEIDAKRLFHEAKAAQAEGDQRLTQQLLDDAARLDPRMRTLWNQDLFMFLEGQDFAAARDCSGPSSAGLNGRAQEPGSDRDARQVTGPLWPIRLALHEGREPGDPGGAPHIASARDTSALPGTPASAFEQEEADPGGQQHRARSGTCSADPPDWCDAVMQKERQDWQPQVVPPDDTVALAAESTGPEAVT